MARSALERREKGANDGAFGPRTFFEGAFGPRTGVNEGANGAFFEGVRTARTGAFSRVRSVLERVRARRVLEGAFGPRTAHPPSLEALP
jgi:hypothetical protein